MMEEQKAMCVVPSLVINLVTETRGIDNGQGDAGAFIVKLEL